MGYYMGDYYAGDYYGDPFLGKLFKKIGKGIKGAVGGFLSGGPIGAIGGAGRAVFSKVQTPLTARMATPVLRGGVQMRSFGATKVPGLRGVAQRAIPGGATGFEHLLPARRRRINPINPKALRRAIRRMDGFVKLARRSLRHTNYKITSKSAGRAKSKRR